MHELTMSESWLDAQNLCSVNCNYFSCWCGSAGEASVRRTAIGHFQFLLCFYGSYGIYSSVPCCCAACCYCIGLNSPPGKGGGQWQSSASASASALCCLVHMVVLVIAQPWPRTVLIQCLHSPPAQQLRRHGVFCTAAVGSVQPFSWKMADRLKVKKPVFC